MSHPTTPTWFLAAIVVRQGDRFLLIRETGSKECWGYPGWVDDER